jgi:hypothetical protein
MKRKEKRIKQRQPPQPGQPQYLIKFVSGGEHFEGLYYSPDIAWKGCAREQAKPYTHKQARGVQGHLKRRAIELATVLESK